MYPVIKGPTPFAIILCRFSDVAIPSVPKSKFYKFLGQSGCNGLFDYWRDVSYGNIDLSGSEVFGWYTMSLSYIRDSRRHRSAFIQEAQRLAGADGIDLERFHGLIVILNGVVHGSSSGPNMVGHSSGAWGQPGWRQCGGCHGMIFSEGGAAKCTVAPTHSLVGSYNYALALNDSTFPGQDGWRHCAKCHAIVYTGSQVAATCSAGGTHGLADSGSYRLAFGSVGFAGQSKWRWCKKCQILAYSDSGSGFCAGGANHDFSDSGDYTIIHLADENSAFNMCYVAHENGHSFGLRESWAADPGVAYGDPWDIMSAMRVRCFYNNAFSPAGPGLNAPSLWKLGWLDESRQFSFNPSWPQTAITLAALNRPDQQGYLMARILTPDKIYTIELRQPTGWDAGIARSVVLIHELRSGFSVGENGWRWCNKCQGLKFAGTARCAAGSLHNHVGSGNYDLALNNPTAVGDQGWRWCRACQAMTNHATKTEHNGPAPCPAGGAHDQGASGVYTLPVNDPEAQGQDQWRWCGKCECLTYGGLEFKGACAAHGSHDHSGSGNYTISHNGSTRGQSEWRCCSKCKILAFDGYTKCIAGESCNYSGSGDYSLPQTDGRTPGEQGWKVCNKCQGLAYDVGSLGFCPAGGSHDHANATDHTLLYNVPNRDSRNSFKGHPGWSHCAKCQLLYYSTNGDSTCPAGNQHEKVGFKNYTLANFGQDLSFLVRDLQAGQEFSDARRNVHINVGHIDEKAGTVRVTLGYGAKLPAAVLPVHGDTVTSLVARMEEVKVPPLDPEPNGPPGS